MNEESKSEQSEAESELDQTDGNENYVPVPGRDHSQAPHGAVGMDIDPTSMDSLWAKELLELGVDERNTTDENLHGIRSLAVTETPELLRRNLNDMQEEIYKLPDVIQEGHTRGLELGSMYIQSLAFRLKFLRAVQFDAKMAAFRYCNCLNMLCELFGESALTRRLHITDLGEEETEYMKEGHFQVLPSRDRLGRRIVVFNMRQTKKTYSIDAMFKVYVYFLQAVVCEDISTQKHGMVYIGVVQKNESIAKQDRKQTSMDLHRVHKMYAGTPLFWGAVHLCLPDEVLYRMFTALFLAWIGRAGRKLLRIHRGNRIECNYSLRSFGIPVGDMPLMHAGEIKTKNHMRLIKLRMDMDKWDIQQEKKFKSRRRSKSAPETIKPFPGIECPEVDFVVLSYLRNTDGAQNDHPGNVAFRKIMVQNDGFKSFLNADDGSEFNIRPRLLQVVDDVLFDACVEGLQFLTYDLEKGYYSEVVDQDVLRTNVERIMRRYRNHFRSKLELKKRNSRSSPSTTSPTQQNAFDLSSNEDKMDCCL
mmetsp:Transcript_6428/g.15601  ORF Transcript_6428/g.15601 Transcript_6428/m.15601 type:complete len:532 (-) Transcript_6428:315-1910(-)